jgi:hypothetical protein
MRLSELAAHMIEQLRAKKLEATKANIKRVGNPVVRHAPLYEYSPECYGKGEWVSGNLMRRIGAGPQARRGREGERWPRSSN